MNRILTISLLFCLFARGAEIPLEEAQIRSFGETVELNSKVIQLSNAKQSIMPLISGHVERYFVEAGSKVKAGQKIALIESLSLSKMTSDYLALKESSKAVMQNYEAAKKLYAKGMVSLEDLNLRSIQKDESVSNMNALVSQLRSLGIDADKVKRATSEYVLYAHASGTISSLLQPLHSVINEDTPLVSVVKEHALYIESYVPMEYAHRIKAGQKLIVEHNAKEISTSIVQVLPEADERTQRVVVLSSLDDVGQKLFINTYLPSRLYLGKNELHVAVKKSALSFFENEWVVFVPKESEDEHREHDEDNHYYEPRVVDIVAWDEEYTAVEGIIKGETYVSDRTYYVKSILLKSSLGGHGH